MAARLLGPVPPRYPFPAFCGTLTRIGAVDKGPVKAAGVEHVADLFDMLKRPPECGTCD